MILLYILLLAFGLAVCRTFLMSSAFLCPSLHSVFLWPCCSGLILHYMVFSKNLSSLQLPADFWAGSVQNSPQNIICSSSALIPLCGLPSGLAAQFISCLDGICQNRILTSFILMSPYILMHTFDPTPKSFPNYLVCSISGNFALICWRPSSQHTTSLHLRFPHQDNTHADFKTNFNQLNKLCSQGNGKKRGVSPATSPHL